MYLSAIEILICYTKIEVNRVYFLRFCTKYDTCFSKYGLGLIVALSSTNATKVECPKRQNFEISKMSIGGNDTYKNKLVKML